MENASQATWTMLSNQIFTKDETKTIKLLSCYTSLLMHVWKGCNMWQIARVSGKNLRYVYWNNDKKTVKSIIKQYQAVLCSIKQYIKTFNSKLSSITSLLMKLLSLRWQYRVRGMIKLQFLQNLYPHISSNRRLSSNYRIQRNIWPS